MCVKEREKERERGVKKEERRVSVINLRRGREVEKRKKVLKLFKGTADGWQALLNVLRLRIEAKACF